MFNQITLVGNMGDDPDIKQTSAGNNFAIFSLATNRVIKGEKSTDWHKVVVWDDKIADILSRYTKKGSRIMIQGRLTYREWEQDGAKRVSAEVHLDRFDSQMKLMDSRGEASVSPIDKQPNEYKPSDVKFDDMSIDDEIPI